ncbi:ricin-type beta-trefoil lectin domain protein [Cognatishimia sp. SS12]|uniref:RICIN domain-containing protein n=1 Tax=Cognatishimia sp. SS12 TaxID=2979465 RepID=UPI00232C9979|nr:ricin-type beta-trefoil lectin domain protein [Cognatishimia sp. SS12]MDC0738363.1 ricin-type beta-trefoil lectin domain protein [Cognatishimia sp. SS12]
MKFLYVILPLALPNAVLAEEPNIQTPAPVLYLADNLDEPDKLGYCLDTVGRGQSNRAHVHSCKPRGGDVQFFYDDASQQILSATFSGICLDIADTEFALAPCTGSQSQKFSFESESGEIRPAAAPNLCLSTSADSRQAGPYLSRDLILSTCEDTPVELKRWRQRK